MALTSAHTISYSSTKAMSNLAVHNKREFDEDHKAPGYLLAPEHHDPRGNESYETNLTPARVIQEYLETNAYGKRHGKLRYNARPLRETVVRCQESTTMAQVKKLMIRLERELPFRGMYAHIHRDEGHVDKDTGWPVRNYHVHIGHTNLIAGKLKDPGKAGLSRMQNICAKVLGMERGESKKETKRVHLAPAEYRRLAKEKENAVTKAKTAAETTANVAAQARIKEGKKVVKERDDLKIERDELKENYKALGELNRSFRNQMKESGLATGDDYQVWKKTLEDPDTNYDEKVAASEKLLESIKARVETVETANIALVKKNKELQKQLTDSEIAIKEDYKARADINRSNLPLDKKIIKIAEFVDNVLAPAEELPAPLPATQKTKGDTLYKLTGGQFGKPPRQQWTSSPFASTPAPAPVPAVPLLADMMRDWIQQKTQAAQIAADQAAAKQIAADQAAEDKTRQADVAQRAKKEQDRTNEITTLRKENKGLNEDVFVWRKLFLPLFRVYGELSKKRKEPDIWLDLITKAAIKMAETFMPMKEEEIRTRYRDPTSTKAPDPFERD